MLRLNGRWGFILAHPDDETFMAGALIRRLADSDGRPVLLVATRGEAGFRNGDYADVGPQRLAAIRDAEMAEAGRVLGLTEIEQLGYPDGKLNEADAGRLAGQIAAFADRHGVTTLVTFPPDGGNGHPDHIAISMATTMAFNSGKIAGAKLLLYAMSDAMAAGRRPDLRQETTSRWPVKAAALRAHDSQKYAIGRYFGSLDTVRPERMYENFVVGGER